MERTTGKRFGYILATIITICFVIGFSIRSGNTENRAYASSASSYAVIDISTGKILLSENADTRLPMASTTKIMTALLLIENCDPNETVEIDDRCVGVEGSSVYLRKGEKLTVNDLLYCLMLRSGNDSAVALALHMAESIEDFAEIMNIRAESIGLENTHFTNPHGLHDDNHYTSAHDLAVISAIAMNNPTFRKIVNTHSIVVGKGESARKLINKNKMLRLYPGANGVKTGFTKKSGRCLVSSATRNGKTLVCVVLNISDTYGKSAELLNKGFSLTDMENA